MNHGKPISTDMDAHGTAHRADDARGCADGGNRTMRNVALQQGLRAAYRTVVEEPLPDRLLALLQQLDGDGSAR